MPANRRSVSGGPFQAGMDELEEIQLPHPRSTLDGSASENMQHEFGVDPFSAQPVEELHVHRALDQVLGMLAQAEIEPLFEPDGAQHPRRVFHEREAVQDPDRPVLDVAQAAEEIEQFPVPLPVQAHGKRIDREVAAVEVFLDRGQLDGGQGGRRLVVFQPGRGDIDLEPARQHDHRGPELQMRLHAAAGLLDEHPGERDPVALDHDIDIEVRHMQEQVPDDAADEVDREIRLRRQPRRSLRGPGRFLRETLRPSGS